MTETNYICQSCGMPLASSADRGAESDGTASSLYCTHCYQNGSFTEPDMTINLMVERVAPIMEQMFEMPIEKGKLLSRCQIQNLFRWSGRMIPSCESCGMPLASEEDKGTEKDGSHSVRYCTHCYQSGMFTEPDLTRETMIAKYAPLMSAEYDLPIHKAEEMVRSFTATLPRWR